MTFRCEKCARTSMHGEPSNRIVVETKEHEHPFRKDANRDGSPDKGGRGAQIAKEMTVCSQCLP